MNTFLIQEKANGSLTRASLQSLLERDRDIQHEDITFAEHAENGRTQSTLTRQSRALQHAHVHVPQGKYEPTCKMCKVVGTALPSHRHEEN